VVAVSFRLPKLVDGVRRFPGVDDIIELLTDNKGPGLPPELLELLAAFQGGKRDGYEDFAIAERCIFGPNTPIVPGLDGNYVQLIQSKDHVVLLTDATRRIIPIDSRLNLGDKLRSWSGDPRGHWEGDTLVVDTSNFNDKTVVGQTQTSELLHVTERFTRVSADTIEYEATIEDPRTWARPWTVTVPLSTQPGYQIFPYECHEGNFALRNILSAARAEERATADAIRNGTTPPEPTAWQGNTGLLPDDPSFGRPQGR
jgi:hypothetical protein